MGEGRAVTGDSGSKAGQGRVFTGEKDERGHSEVGLSSSSYLPIYGLGTCATLLREFDQNGGESEAAAGRSGREQASEATYQAFR